MQRKTKMNQIISKYICKSEKISKYEETGSFYYNETTKRKHF